MKKIFFKTVILFFSVIFIYSCKKDKDQTPDQTTISETSQTQSEFDDIQKQAEDVMDQKNAGTLRLASTHCYTFTWDSSANKLITLHFDSTICTADGKRRSGDILIHYTDLFRNAGAVITITLQNYYVNGNKIEGSKVITNNGFNSNGKHSYSVAVRDVPGGSGFAKISWKDGSTTTWKADRTNVWDQGSSTFSLLDDEWLVDGTFSGVTRAGVSFSGSLSAIRIRIACFYSFIFYPVSGVLSVTTNEGTRSLDFGNGTCDKDAKFTALNGKVYDITLR